MSREHRLESWMTGVALAGLLLSIGPLLFFRAHLPDPLASHYGPTGVPNGKLPLAALVTAPCAIVMVCKPTNTAGLTA